jgi:hypothetical protein
VLLANHHVQFAFQIVHHAYQLLAQNAILVIIYQMVFAIRVRILAHLASPDVYHAHLLLALPAGQDIILVLEIAFNVLQFVQHVFRTVLFAQIQPAQHAAQDIT